MPAAALAHLDNEDEVVSAPAAAVAAPASPKTAPNDDNLDWSHVSTYADRFSGMEEVGKARVRRKVVRRHRPFGWWSGVTLASAIVFLELLGLVWLRALDLQAMRHASQLDKEIALTNEGIARTQKQIAALNSSPHLSKWATDLEYRPANMGDFDDVTKNEPYKPAEPQGQEQ